MEQIAGVTLRRECHRLQVDYGQSHAKAEAIAKVRELMSTHGLSAADLVAPAKTKQGAKQGSKVAAKYKDPVTGSTWTGRGLKPKWLSAAIEGGKTLGDFAI